MSAHLSILESAISDVGYWRWWTTNLPESFQLEFGGTQLWSPPESPDKPPSSLIALRLRRPSVAVFLSAAGSGLAADWFDALQRDELDPFSVDHERFTLSSHEDARNYLSEAARTHAIVGSANVHALPETGVVMAFWAGPVGFFGIAESLAVITKHGEVPAEAVAEMNTKWWQYWREYWQQKDGPAPLPQDYACEVTIPLKND